MKLLKVLGLIVTIMSCIQCEKDDVCIDEGTPEIGVYFYSKSTLSTLNKNNFSVSINGSIAEEITTATSSFTIDLSQNTDTTLSILLKNITDDNTGEQDLIELNFDRNLGFISKACGYKEIYENMTLTDSLLSTIDSIAITQNVINDELEEHIQLYFN